MFIGPYKYDRLRIYAFGFFFNKVSSSSILSVPYFPQYLLTPLSNKKTGQGPVF